MTSIAHTEVIAQTPLEKLLSKLTDVSQVGKNQWEARCPAHDDRKASLAISIGTDGRALIHCHAGCRVPLIVYQCGISMSELFPDHGREKQRSTIVASYDYCDENGEMLFQVCRMNPKDFRQRRPTNNGNALDWGTKGVRKVLYRLPQLLKADIEAPIFIVEGEKDADNLAKNGVVSTTSPGGADKWKAEYSESLAGRTVVIIPDNDEPGRKHAHAVARSLMGKAKSVKILALPGLPLKGDVSDWLKAGGTREQLLQLAETTLEVDIATLSEGKTEPTAKPTTKITQRSADDPHDLATKFLNAVPGELSQYVNQCGEWRKFTGTHYRDIDEDTLDADVTRSIYNEFVADYQWRAENANGEEVKPMRHVTRNVVRNVIGAAKSIAAFEDPTVPQWRGVPKWLQSGDRLPDPKLCVNLRNGIFVIERFLGDNVGRTPEDVQIDGDYLRPHDPALLTSTCLPFEFDAKATCPEFGGELFAMFNDGDDEKTNKKCRLFQEWLGYIITPDTSKQKMLILHGAAGSGKSSLIACMQALVGEGNYSSVALSALGERFQAWPIVGRLVNFSSDERRIDLMNEGLLKSIVSGDSIEIDRKNRKPFIGRTPTRLVCAANHFPQFTDTSNGTWRRLIPISCPNVISKQERQFGRDKPEWWNDSGRMPGIFNFALRGLQELHQLGGFDLGPSLAEELAEQKTDASPVARFVQSTCKIDPDGWAFSSELYAKYAAWMKENGHAPRNSVGFGRELHDVCPQVVKRRNGKEIKYCGIRHTGE